LSRYEDLSKEELIARLKQLEAKKYGLVWDKEKEPEQVVLECQNNIPILTKDSTKTINSSEEDLRHILIEGDNYHSLQVLNYTHKGKVDVIYIDPPYNTGNKDFCYNDHFVDKEDGYRHSKWLSFIDKRLRLAHSLLSDKGVVFISIDDNEMSQLKLLCDDIFHSDNFIAILPRVVKKGGKSTESISKNNDYVLVYFKSSHSHLKKLSHNDKGFKYKDEYFEERGYYKLNQTLDYDSIQYSKSLDYMININNLSITPGGVSLTEMAQRQEENPVRDFCWRWSKKRYDFGLAQGFVVLKEYANKLPRIYTKTYEKATIEKDTNSNYYVDIVPRMKPLSSLSLIDNIYSNDNAKKELRNFFGKVEFDYPKPSALIRTLLSISTDKNSIILDFFAGSGTTGQAVLQLNNEDGGKRQVILCTNNESDICEKVTYPRLNKVINGYITPKKKEIAGLGGNLDYYKTALIPIENIQSIIDEEREALAKQAGNMIAIKENTTKETLLTDKYQIFTNNSNNILTAIYFSEDLSEFDNLLNDTKEHLTMLYIYSYGKIDKSAYQYLGENYIVKDIPQPIINIYKEINKEATQ